MLPLLATLPEETHKFTLFGLLHCSILFLTVGIPFLLSRFTRHGARPSLARAICVGLSIVLLLDYLFAVSWSVHIGKIVNWAEALPLQLCDWAAITAMLALLWRHQQPYELAYLWGLSGTFQALLTPDIAVNFPDPLFFAFFLSHSGIVVAILYLTWGLGFRPRPGAVLRAWGWSQVYFVGAGVANWTLHTNFGYLGAKPPHPSLLDFFGPWPWYLLVLEAVALLFFTIFYSPFYFMNRRAKLINSPSPPPSAAL